jgi:hypothetical protein
MIIPLILRFPFSFYVLSQFPSIALAGDPPIPDLTGTLRGFSQYLLFSFNFSDLLEGISSTQTFLPIVQLRNVIPKIVKIRVKI